MSNIGSDGVVTDTTKQGGLAAAYYFGAMFGGFIGGWFGDKYGRKKGSFVGAILSLLGSALQCGSINADMFICARVIAGLGIGFINVLILSWVSELSETHDRGSTFSLVFIANFLGIFIANWLNFGIRNNAISFRWRFPLGFMCIPMTIVAICVFLVPGMIRLRQSLCRYTDVSFYRIAKMADGKPTEGRSNRDSMQDPRRQGHR